MQAKEVRISPKIGEGPHLKDVDNKDKVEGKFWDNSTISKLKNHQLIVIEACKSQRFLSSLWKISL